MKIECRKLVSGQSGLAQFATEGHYLNTADFIKEILGESEVLSFMQTQKVANHDVNDLYFALEETQEIDMDNVSNAKVIIVVILGILPRWYNCEAKVYFNKDGCWITDEELERHY